jgi:hypothetical protein
MLDSFYDDVNITRKALDPVYIPNYDDTDENMVYVLQFFHNYIVTFICLFGILTNTLTIIVLNSKNMKKRKIFKLMIYEACFKILYLIQIFFIFTKYNIHTAYSFERSHFANVYQLYCIDYLTSCLAISFILIEIVISIKQYNIVKNSKLFKDEFRTGKIMLCIITASLFYYMPVFFIKTIKSEIDKDDADEGLLYKVVHTDFGTTFIAKIMLISMKFIRGPIFLTILLSINITMMWKFNQQMERKKGIKNRSIPLIGSATSDTINKKKSIFTLLFLKVLLIVEFYLYFYN